MSRSGINFKRIAPCLFSIIVDYAGLGLVYPIVTAMFTEVPETIFPSVATAAARDFYMGLAYLLYPLFMFFGAAILGDLSDKYGRKRVLLLAMAGICVSFLLMSYGIHMHSLSLFLFGRACSGLMAGSQPLCMAAIADLSTAENKAWNMRLVTLTNCVGLVFGPFVAGVFTQSFFLRIVGFPFPFMIAALLAVIGFALILFLFQETFKAHVEKEVSFTRPITIFIDAFKDKKVRLLCLIVFFQLLGLMLYYQTVGIYFRELWHYSSSLLGFFYGFMGIFFALGVLIVIPFVLKRWKNEKIASYGFLIMGICALASIFYRNEAYLWADVIPFAAAHATGFTALAALFSNSADRKNQGWIMGVCAATIAVAYVVAGFSTNLLPLLGSRGLIALGGISGILSSVLMFHYAATHRSLTSRKIP